MSDPNTVLPASTPSGLLRVQESSKLAFGATTAALVTLASGGTALLVSQGAGTLSSPTTVPGLSAPLNGGQGGGALVIGRPAGTTRAHDKATAAKAADDETARVLREALALRPPPRARTLLAPLIQLPVVDVEPRVPTAPTVPPVAAPPVVPVVAKHPVHKAGDHKARDHKARDHKATDRETTERTEPKLNPRLQQLQHEEDDHSHKKAKKAKQAKPAKARTSADAAAKGKPAKGKGAHEKPSRGTSRSGRHAR